MGSLFTLDRVGLEVEGTSILDDLSVVLPDGGISVVVGPSGSGKSTMLRMLNGLERPTTGAIEFRGEPLAGLEVRRLRRRVGMVFQRPTVFDGTALDNLQVADGDLDRDAAVDALGRVGLGSEILDRDARRLSGGEAQRLCLARTLATQPEVVLLDEPTSALDEENARLIETLIEEIVVDGVRIVLVSHDRSQVERLADWVVHVRDGRVVTAGRPSELGDVEPDSWRRSPDSDSTVGEQG